MTTLVHEYVKFAWSVMLKPELIIAGVQRIHRDVGWSIEPSVFFDGSMKLGDTGYTQSKLTQLQRNYYNPEGIKRAKADLRWRIDNRKYGSGAFTFYGIPKKVTKQDFCLQSCVISYYPQKKSTTVHVFWRTAELFKRFRGDILFLRDFILPHFNEEFDEAPAMAVDFRFANCTAHPMYSILLMGMTPDWRPNFEQLRQCNPSCFRSCMYWAWRYLLDDSGSIDKYSSAKQVRVIAERIVDPVKLDHFRRYVKRRILDNLEDYPDSVKEFYR